MLLRFVLILLFLTLPADAAELLLFRDYTKGVREENVLATLMADKILDSALPYEIGAFDLNNDGVDEWIFRQDPTADCEASNACTFTIIGLSRKKPVVLGNTKARKIGISSEKTYGIHNLLVYNQRNDDFAYTVFSWAPYERRFTSK